MYVPPYTSNEECLMQILGVHTKLFVEVFTFFPDRFVARAVIQKIGHLAFRSPLPEKSQTHVFHFLGKVSYALHI